MRRFVGFILLAVATACGSSSSGGGGNANSGNTVPLLAGFTPGAAPDPSKGFQVITPIVNDIEPGASVEYCTWTNIILTQDTWVDASQGFQTEGGHHIIVYYSTSHQQPDTHICQNDEMGEFQFGMPANQAGTLYQLPGDLAVKLPAGSQLVVNHHYLNAGATAIAQAQSAINVWYADPTVQHTPSGSMIVLDTTLTVPTGASSFTVDCTINQTYNAWLLVPHMHAWGSHIRITDTTSSGPQMLFDLDWDPSYAFDPTAVQTKKDPSTPFVLSAGDKIHIQCDYLNTTGAEMTFGDEMCVFATFTVDPNNVGNVECDRGTWGNF